MTLTANKIGILSLSTEISIKVERIVRVELIYYRLLILQVTAVCSEQHGRRTRCSRLEAHLDAEVTRARRHHIRRSLQMLNRTKLCSSLLDLIHGRWRAHHTEHGILLWHRAEALLGRVELTVRRR